MYKVAFLLLRIESRGGRSEGKTEEKGKGMEREGKAREKRKGRKKVSEREENRKGREMERIKLSWKWEDGEF